MKKYSGVWTNIQLKQLLRRSLYGVTREDYKFFREKSMDECIDILLSPSPLPPPPNFYDTTDSDIPFGTTFVFSDVKPEDEEYRMLFIKAWWIELMKNQYQNVTERMVMFWHNHFATEFKMVEDSRYYYQYLTLIRQYATGNFKKLLREITINAQMLVYLNGNLNNKAEPNENYAREVQELFTVGKGPDSRYTEDDVKNAAKVLTGWKDDKMKIATYFDPAFHSTEDKIFSAFYNNHTIKGRSGDDGAEETFELLDMLCNQRETSKFLCRKLYRWFVGCHIDEQVEEEVIAPLADIMIQSDYEIKPVLRAIFSGDFFYDPYLTGSIIKSPVDFTVELLRQFKIENPFLPNQSWKPCGLFSIFAAKMGQDIGNPPQVAGWPAYYVFPFFDKEWITSDKLIERHKLVITLSAKLDRVDMENNLLYDLTTFVSGLSNPSDPQQVLDEAIDLLFCVPLGGTQITYLLSLLNTAQNPKLLQNWNTLWTMYTSADREDVKEEVTDRLRFTFETMLTYPEYQIR